nr:hypothetical protein CFP56_68748 [Quercus suber]
MFVQYQVTTWTAKLQHGSGGIRGTRWRPLQASFVKINFDGTMFAYKAKEIEALATLKALQFVYDLGFQKARLEGDSLGLIKALKAEDHNLSSQGLLVEDVKLVANNFVSLSYSHIKRNGNSVAHNLAEHVIRIPDFQVWIADAPSHVVSFLHSNVVHLP